MPLTAIFDIGKTNKKCVLFNEDYQVRFQQYTTFPETSDNNGFPCDDLPAIQTWVKNTLSSLLKNLGDNLNAVNFSTYGASFVHLDKNGTPLLPLLNYLKPYPQKTLDTFHKHHGHPLTIARDTASPPLGMLNSGLQLYWLKHNHPDIFKKTRWSLHLPQYLSYLLTGIPLSDYTSTGCHTTLWDFSKNDYHDWVYKEEIDRILPPLVPTNTSINTHIGNKKITVGTGIHDSSAALLPYLRAGKHPFLLISTGTWSISLNPFNHQALTDAELQQDCLSFLRPDGQPVRAARLFLGEEYKLQTQALQTFFKKNNHAHTQVPFDESLYEQCAAGNKHCFPFAHLKTPWQQPPQSEPGHFDSFEAAYHQLMWELVQLQAQSANLAIGNTPVRYLYIDGGFADNPVYVQMMARQFKHIQLRTAQAPLGSALGAAMAISDKDTQKNFLKEHYALKKL
jgi:sugar (pentulose or hexulose) kinase